jgi:hypothetical protein
MNFNLKKSHLKNKYIYCIIMKNYNIDVLEDTEEAEDIMGATTFYKTLYITKKNGKSLTFDNVTEITKALDNAPSRNDDKYTYDMNYTIIAQTIVNSYFTIKSMYGPLKYDSLDDYLDGRVKNTTKFKKIYSIQVKVITERYKKKVIKKSLKK